MAKGVTIFLVFFFVCLFAFFLFVLFCFVFFFLFFALESGLRGLGSGPGHSLLSLLLSGCREYKWVSDLNGYKRITMFYRLAVPGLGTSMIKS